jgi:hypothetical protein
MRPLESCLASFRQWLYLPDPGALEVAIATAAANYAEGDALWLLLVGAPGSGKTEILIPLGSLPDARLVATLTEGGLLSGTPKHERSKSASGGLLRELGAFGILIAKDFGSILSMNRDTRAVLLAALREIYDGAWTRHVGVDGGKSLSWQGKVAIIGGCTPAIDSHHAVLSAMGERFLLYRIHVADARSHAASAIGHIGREREMREQLAEAVTAVVDDADQDVLVSHPGPEARSRLIDLAQLVARARSSVERDGYKREIELVPDSEAPGRLSIQLLKLLNGLLAIGVAEQRAWELVTKTALDSMPAIRRGVLDCLIAADGARTTTEVALTVDYPTSTTRRTLEDLAAHGVLQRASLGKGKPDLWHLAEWVFELKPLSFSEKSVQAGVGVGRTSDSSLHMATDISEKASDADPLGALFDAAYLDAIGSDMDAEAAAMAEELEL